MGLAAKWKLAQIVVAPVSVRAAVPLRAPLRNATSTTPDAGAARLAVARGALHLGIAGDQLDGVGARQELRGQLELAR